jgi:hypothetical protein
MCRNRSPLKFSQSIRDAPTFFAYAKPFYPEGIGQLRADGGGPSKDQILHLMQCDVGQGQKRPRELHRAGHDT